MPRGRVCTGLENVSRSWVRQYGDAWAPLTALKRRYDPDGILTPGPGILP
jgi:FAD/FMN-containing dehydrogenase